ncbi:hypothetical protein P4055_08475 [Pseudomonas aeruginosa]|nr:hypothetical protein [Pseudomonas aeruginosa]
MDNFGSLFIAPKTIKETNVNEYPTECRKDITIKFSEFHSDVTPIPSILASAKDERPSTIKYRGSYKRSSNTTTGVEALKEWQHSIKEFHQTVRAETI